MSPLVWIAVLLGCAATFDDLRRRAIANWINLAGMAAGLDLPPGQPRSGRVGMVGGRRGGGFCWCF